MMVLTMMASVVTETTSMGRWVRCVAGVVPRVTMIRGRNVMAPRRSQVDGTRVTGVGRREWISRRMGGGVGVVSVHIVVVGIFCHERYVTYE